MSGRNSPSTSTTPQPTSIPAIHSTLSEDLYVILTAVEPPELLARMLPTQELREKVEIGADYLAKAKVMRITSPHGTDVTYKLNTYPTVAEYACTDTPGRWDHWPSGFVFTGGDDDGVDGQIVVATGPRFEDSAPPSGR